MKEALTKIEEITDFSLRVMAVFAIWLLILFMGILFILLFVQVSTS